MVEAEQVDRRIPAPRIAIRGSITAFRARADDRQAFEITQRPRCTARRLRPSQARERPHARINPLALRIAMQRQRNR